MNSVPAEHRLVLVPIRRAILMTVGAALVALGCAANPVDAQTENPDPRPTATPTATPKAKGKAKASPAPATPTATPAESSTANLFKVSGTDGEGLRVRASASLSANILARVPEGTTLTLGEGVGIEADDERWVAVKVSGVSGYAAARYLTRVATQAPVVKELPTDAPFGLRAAAFAQLMLGQPYVWGGTKPGGFDCSGFAQWVYTQAGVSNMARQIPGQLALGKKVEGSLQAGDLVAFVDTYTSGLSHVGVMINETQFVHAADESRGVTTSEIADQYWKSRLHQAVRLR